jgi:aminoglycoside phosphotransferase (APT) family kinase protein
MDARGRRHSLVVRRYVGHDPVAPAAQAVRYEASILRALETSGLPAPRLIDADPEGVRAGVPALVMSRVPGRVHLTPQDPESWLRQMAAMLPRIHELSIHAGDFEPWFDPSQLSAPASTRNAATWRAAIRLVSGAAPSYERRFIHRDYQHFNLLWYRGRLSGVVDWCYSCGGPPDADVAHCRLNLAVLFSADWAERFRLAYEAEAGRAVDAWWDIAGLMSYSHDMKESIPIQVGNRMRVDVEGMDSRIDDLLALALRRA